MSWLIRRRITTLALKYDPDSDVLKYCAIKSGNSLHIFFIITRDISHDWNDINAYRPRICAQKSRTKKEQCQTQLRLSPIFLQHFILILSIFGIEKIKLN